MSKLSPEARDLVEAARGGERPSAQTRERVRARVLARVGAAAAVGSAAALGSTGTAAKTALSTALLYKLAAALGVAGVVSMVALQAGLLPRPSPDQGSRPVAATAPSPTAVDRAEAPELPASKAPAPVEASKALASGAARPHAVTTGTSPLEAETALLKKAQAELRAGRPEQALAALDEHDAQFKQGVLREEQRAARILALCAADRTSEAKAMAQRFLAESPRSPMAARVRSSCAFDAGAR